MNAVAASSLTAHLSALPVGSWTSSTFQSVGDFASSRLQRHGDYLADVARLLFQFEDPTREAFLDSSFAAMDPVPQGALLKQLGRGKEEETIILPSPKSGMHRFGWQLLAGIPRLLSASHLSQGNLQGSASMAKTAAQLISKGGQPLQAGHLLFAARFYVINFRYFF